MDLSGSMKWCPGPYTADETCSTGPSRLDVLRGAFQDIVADTDFDLFVGKCEYIEDKVDFFWGLVEDSHSHLDSVLAIEKRLTHTYASDEQFCFDDRLGRTIKTQCEPYSRTYMESMDGMVQSRMRTAIVSTANAWYTAWVDAGSPDLSSLVDVEFTKEELEAFRRMGENKTGVEFKVRAHNH